MFFIERLHQGRVDPSLEIDFVDLLHLLAAGFGSTLPMPDVRCYGEHREYSGHGTISTNQKSGVFATGIL
jgi:hypothetical protein